MVAGGAGLIVAAWLFIFALVALVSIFQGALAFSKKSPLKTASVLAGLKSFVIMSVILKNFRYVPISETFGNAVKFTAGAAVFFVATYLFCVAFFLVGKQFRLLIFTLHKFFQF